MTPNPDRAEDCADSLFRQLALTAQSGWGLFLSSEG